MTAQPAGRPDPVEPFEVIHLGGEPLEAEIEATLAAHDEWLAAGCPGTRSHEGVMAELLGRHQ
jgi:hypothetical protein